MTSNFSINGSIVALITPMFENGDIDFVALEKLVNWHIKSGTSAIVSMGTTGESATLDNDEHIKVIKKTIEFAKGQIPVIAGSGANSTNEAIYLTQEAKKVGATAVLLVTPYYNKPTQNGLYLHYKSIAESVDIPQILYNVPSRTGVDMLPETIKRLSVVDNIIGVKDATGDLMVAKELINICPANFMLYSGDDATACEFIFMGGSGGISVASNIVPSIISQIYKLAKVKNNNAKIINSKLVDLYRILFIESNPIPVKWMLAKMNKCNLGIRLPLTIFSAKLQQDASIILRNLEII